MNYKDYIKNAIQELTDDYVINVVDEVNFNYNPDDKEILVVIKQLSGSVTGNVRANPIQLNIFTSADEVNDTMEIFNNFVAKYSNTHTMLGLDYYKQDYFTPIDMNNFMQVGNTQRAEILITGSLVITNSISDIKSVKINNKEINYTSVNFTYSTSVNTSKPSGKKLQQTMIENANLLITLVSYANIDVFNTMISLHKLGIKGPNDIYTLQFEYTDDTTQEYKCIIYSFNENYDISNPPLRNVVFALC